MAKWMAEQGSYKFTIEEAGEHFDLLVEFLTEKQRLWFRSYVSARNFLRKEYSLTGRMKKVGE